MINSSTVSYFGMFFAGIFALGVILIFVALILMAIWFMFPKKKFHHPKDDHQKK